MGACRWPLRSHPKDLVSQHPAGRPRPPWPQRKLLQCPGMRSQGEPQPQEPPPALQGCSPQPVGTPAHPVCPRALPGVAAFQLPPPTSMAVPDEGEGWVPRASPHRQHGAERGSSCGPEAGTALRAGRAAARGHRRAVGCTGALKALGVLGAPALPPLPSHLATSQMCFGAEPCPVPPSSRDSPTLQHPRHLDDRDSEQASPAQPRHVPAVGAALTHTRSPGSHAQAGRRRRDTKQAPAAPHHGGGQCHSGRHLQQ